MADAARRTTPTLKEELFEKPAEFSFLQAVALLWRFFSQENDVPETCNFLYDVLRIRPHLSLAFPGSDITDLRETQGATHPVYHITATFLGLYGASSPLPTFYTEDLLDERSDDITVTRDFLDVVNSPLYPLLLRAMSKYRPFFHLDQHESSITERLYCLQGYGHQELRDGIAGVSRLPRYIGLFSQWPRSAMGLRTLVSDALSGEPVKLFPNIPRMVAIPDDQRLVLGRQCASLGEDAHLGDRILDIMGRIRLVVGPLDDESFHACLPGGSTYLWIEELVSLYLAEPMECRLEVDLKPEQARPARLGGEKWGILGHDTWLFSGTPPTRCRAVFELKPRGRRS